MKYGDDTFELFLNVGRDKNGGELHIYDISNRYKNRDTANRQSNLERPKPNEGYAIKNDVSTDNIQSSIENVKRNSGTDENTSYSTDAEQSAETDTNKTKSEPSVTINVKEKTDGNYVYSFSAEKENDVAPQTLHAVVKGETAPNESFSIDSIPTPAKNVKGNSGTDENTSYSTDAEQSTETDTEAVSNDEKLTKRYVRTILETGTLSKTVEEKLGTEILLGNFSYEPQSNQKSMDFTNKVIESGNGEKQMDERTIMDKDYLTIFCRSLQAQNAGNDKKFPAAFFRIWHG